MHSFNSITVLTYSSMYWELRSLQMHHITQRGAILRASNMWGLSYWHLQLANNSTHCGMTYSILKIQKTKAQQVSRYFLMEQKMINGFTAPFTHATPVHY
jgi:hypothetical protein